MAYKNRKKNYPLYDNVTFVDIREMVENCKRSFASKIAFTWKTGPKDEKQYHMTFAECADYVRALSTELISRGFRGKRVAIVSRPSHEWVLAFYSLMCISAVAVPIDAELSPDEIASQLERAECEALFFSASTVSKICEVQKNNKNIKLYIKMGHIPSAEAIPEGAISIGALRADGAEKVVYKDRSYFETEIDPEALAGIFFTSGTTGKGKGVMLSQKNLCSNVVNGIRLFKLTEKTMSVLPLHHTFGLTANILGNYCQGIEICFSLGNRYVVQEIKEFRPKHLMLVPLFVETFYHKIMSGAEKSGKAEMLLKLIKRSNSMRKAGIDIRRTLFKSVIDKFGGDLELIICGGAPLSQMIIDFFDGIGITIINGYGITECSPFISGNRNEYRKAGSVGMVMPGGEAKIVDADNNGEGEIAFRGPNVMLGYYQNEEATREVIDEDGFFHTGDIGKVEREDGIDWIFITGRKKNLIILANGKNVYPEEIESDIFEVYGVSEVVVYAGKRSKSNEEDIIVAEIFPDFEALEERGVTDVQKYFEGEVRRINEKNVSFKKVNLIRIRNTEFPKNTSKKIIRYAIDKNID
ncbi:MAG: AMP-binding protein, partial [Clostridia bacterium]|nr:AMP-binding protein [Clostridia bacterium]